MAQLFPKSANKLAPASIVALVLVAGGAVGSLVALDYSGFNQRRGQTVEQQIPFSHEHHVSGLGIDCRYCHTAVEQSAQAGIPPTKTCMNCHSQIWNQSPTLEPVRASLRSGQSIQWVKVNDLPDFVYFNHSAHVNKGVGCTTCHGQVGEMPLVYQATSMQMNWCLDCHRNPEKFLRPKSEVYAPVWYPPADQLKVGAKLRAEYHANPRVSCSTCHR